jgi:hypothetical protein
MITKQTHNWKLLAECSIKFLYMMLI